MVTLAAVAAPFALLNCLKFFHPLGYFGIDDYIFAYGFLLIFFCTARLLPALLRRAVMNHMASMLPDFVRIRKATNSTINQVSSDSSASENKQQSLDKTINDLTKEIDTIMAYEDQLKFVLSDLSKDSHLYKVYSAQLSLTERIRQKAVKTIASYSRKADHD